MYIPRIYFYCISTSSALVTRVSVFVHVWILMVPSGVPGAAGKAQAAEHQPGGETGWPSGRSPLWSMEGGCYFVSTTSTLQFYALNKNTEIDLCFALLLIHCYFSRNFTLPGRGEWARRPRRSSWATLLPGLSSLWSTAASCGWIWRRSWPRSGSRRRLGPRCNWRTWGLRWIRTDR